MHGLSAKKRRLDDDYLSKTSVGGAGTRPSVATKHPLERDAGAAAAAEVERGRTTPQPVPRPKVVISGKLNAPSVVACLKKYCDVIGKWLSSTCFGCCLLG